MDRSTARLPNRLARAEDGAAAPTAMFIEAPTCNEHSLACAATHPHVQMWQGEAHTPAGRPALGRQHSIEEGHTEGPGKHAFKAWQATQRHKTTKSCWTCWAATIQRCSQRKAGQRNQVLTILLRTRVSQKEGR